MASSKIVVGVDGSEPSARAVAWCAEHASAFGAEVVVVHAIDIPLYIGIGSVYMSAPTMTESQRDNVRDIIARDWCKALADAGIPHRILLLDGVPVQVITQVAQEEDAVLIVTGRRGRGGFAELVLGSTSHGLTHHVDRPLLIVP
jgi:nucleotide-binding universal stress UspA family protein